MTISPDSTPEESAGKGTALEMLPAPSTAVDPFTPRAEQPAPRGLRALVLDYSAHAAMIVGLLGFAWTVGDHVVHRPAAADVAPALTAAAMPVPADPLSELRNRNRDLAANVQALQARLDALQTSLGDQSKVAAQVRVLQAGLDSVKTGLGATRNEQSAAMSRLDGKIDKIAQQHEPASKMQQLVDRLGKLERGTVDISSTASLPRSAETKNADGKTNEGKPAEGKITEARTTDSKIADVKPAPVPRPSDLKDDPKLVGADAPGKPGPLPTTPPPPRAGPPPRPASHRSSPPGWSVTSTTGLRCWRDAAGHLKWSRVSAFLERASSNRLTAAARAGR